ncbi:MAG: lipopolysaccharide biosynthesis protein [candidate division Zixibacteria bacterium]|nr:lipopolysaccharide biosynthesis protein [candidate division Zixibacteria bacterium]
MLSSIRAFFKDAVIYGLVGGIRSLTEFLLLPIYAYFLNPTEFGKLDVILVYTAVILVGIIFELTNGVFRFYHDDSSISYRRRLISTITYYHICVAAFAALVICLFSKDISAFLTGTASEANLIVLSAIIVLLNSAITMPLNLLRLQNRPAAYSAISFVQIGVAVGAIVFFVAYRKLGIEGVLLARILSMIPTLIFCFWIQRANLKLNFDFELLAKVAKYSAPLLPVGSAVWIVNALNRYFLLKYTSLDDVGYFSVGQKFTIFITLMVMAFQLAWPQFAFSRINNNQAKPIFSRIFSYYIAASIWVVLFIGFFGKSLIIMQASAIYLPAAGLMVPLSLAMMFYGIFYIFTTGLNITRKTFMILLPMGLGLITNIVLNMLFASRGGAMAVAIVSLFSYLVMALVTLILAQKTYYIPFEWLKLGRSILAAIIIWFAPRLIPPDTSLDFEYKIILFAAYPLLLVLFGFFDKVERDAIMRKLTIKHKSAVLIVKEREYADSHFG